MTKSKSYTLRTKTGKWLGQVVLTDDGMFASVTDYGNFSFAWRAFGMDDFRRFLCILQTDYFTAKMIAGLAYTVQTKKTDDACARFAKKILPPLQAILEKELAENIGWQ